MTAGLEELPVGTLREALRLLGHREPPAQRAALLRELRGIVRGPDGVETILEQAPPHARALFVRLADDGPAPVEALLGRGWWDRGTLPAPLDWLQRRALVLVGPDGRVHATAEAREAFRAPTLAVDRDGDESAAVEAALRVTAARTVVVARDGGALDRAVAAGAGLRAVAATVAVSDRPPETVEAALRAAGLPLERDAGVAVDERAPALPGTPEHAVGPRALRALLDRAVAEERQVRLTYFASSRGGAATERTVDPWTFGDDLLRGYCHLRGGERTFAIDRIGGATLLSANLEHGPPPGERAGE